MAIAPGDFRYWGKADIGRRRFNVSFWPKADMSGSEFR
jgi:hypothetical protein